MYGELAGGTAADGQALSAAVSAALADVAAQCEPGAHVDLTLRSDAGGVEASMSCGSHTRVVSHPLSAAQP